MAREKLEFIEGVEVPQSDAVKIKEKGTHKDLAERDANDVWTFKKLKSIKRDATGAVVFATAADARGTSTAVTAATNPSLTASLTTPANFIKAVVTYTTAGTITAGTLNVQILDGTSVLTSTAVVTPTGAAATVQLTAQNVQATNPVVQATNTGIAGGTIASLAVQDLLNQFDQETFVIP